MRKLTKKEEKWVEKTKDILKIGGKSDKTILNYTCTINRFIKFHKVDINIKNFKEKDIINYIKHDYIDKGCAGSSYNMNLCAIKFFYSVCFNKQFNNNLLPRVKLQKTLPTLIDKHTFINIFSNEKNPKYKCWLYLFDL